MQNKRASKRLKLYRTQDDFKKIKESALANVNSKLPYALIDQIVELSVNENENLKSHFLVIFEALTRTLNGSVAVKSYIWQDIFELLVRGLQVSHTVQIDVLRFVLSCIQQDNGWLEIFNNLFAGTWTCDDMVKIGLEVGYCPERNGGIMRLMKSLRNSYDYKMTFADFHNILENFIYDDNRFEIDEISCVHLLTTCEYWDEEQCENLWEKSKDILAKWYGGNYDTIMNGLYDFYFN
jgi:hypothetical protein